MARQADIDRPVVKFSPSLWGDQFIKYNAGSQVAEKEKYSKIVQVLKNEVRGMITAPASTMVETMDLIDTIERLGVSYHFQNEIEEKLQQFFFDLTNTDYCNEAYDLYTAALHFRLFRQHGYPISCDIFGRWIDGNGKFNEGLKNDGKGLLSLYEASYLRTRGDTILDDAVDFATASLKSMVPLLGDSPLGKQVVHALVQPLHRGVQRIEARHFISIYEECANKNESLLRFARLDYNLLQMLHKEELHELCKWWKELELIEKVPYARDRVVECFFWAMGTYHEPQYSSARIILAKTIAMTSIIDDTYDNYATIEELHLFTQAIQRWHVEEIERLPEYIKPIYKALLELYDQFEAQLAKQGRAYAVSYAKEFLKELARSYLVEAEWFIKGFLPPFEDYLRNAFITSSYSYHTTTSLLGVESVVGEDFQWLTKKPKMLEAGLRICRLIDDVATYEVEKSRGQIATGIESYMKENGVGKEEAVAKLIEMAEDAWKDMNGESLLRSDNGAVSERILNLTRVLDVVYKGNQDGYTNPEKVLKPHITSLLVDCI